MVLAWRIQCVSCLQGKQQYMACDLDLWPLTFEINRCLALVISSMSCKFDGSSLNGSVCIVFTRFNNNVLRVTLAFDPWPWKINRVCPLVISSKCTKFEGPSWNGSVCMVSTSSVGQTDGLDWQTPAPYHNTSGQVGRIKMECYTWNTRPDIPRV